MKPIQIPKLIPCFLAAILFCTNSGSAAINYDFDADEQGWTNVQVSATGPTQFISDTNTQGSRIDQQYAGDGSLRPDPFGSRDAQHSVALWMRSPAFSLTSTTVISFGLIGGLTDPRRPATAIQASPLPLQVVVGRAWFCDV